MAKRTCSIDGCDIRHSARGWCNRHYQRWLLHGDPNYVRPKFVPEHGTTTRYRDGCRCYPCSEVAIAAAREWRERNRERHVATTKAWAERNAKKTVEIKRRWYLANREQAIKAAAERMASRPDLAAEYGARRRARELAAVTYRVSQRDWRRLCARFHGCCAYCGERATLTRDHIIPLSRGGHHSIGNLVPACKPCNSSKHNKLLVEWRAQCFSEGRPWSLNSGLPLTSKALSDSGAVMKAS